MGTQSSRESVGWHLALRTARMIAMTKGVRPRRLGPILLFVGVPIFWITPAAAVPGTTTRVSVDSGGNEGNDFSVGQSISANGRFVAFTSRASNLVPGDTNGVEDIFVHELAPNASGHDRDDNDDESV
jgi:hypothetical protein